MNCINHRDQFAPYNCYLCGNPVCPQCETKLKGRSICPGCRNRLRERVEAEYKAETERVNCPCGFLCGLVAAGAAAFAWSQIALLTGSTFDIGAVVLGGVVGYGVMKGAGDKRSCSLQQIAGALTIAGVFVAYFLTFLRTQPQAYGRLSGGGSDFLGALYAFPAYLGQLTPLAWLLLVAAALLSYYIPHVRALPRR